MTYDRFLMKGFLYTFCVCFIATFGLAMVIDLFENLDEYMELNGNGGTWGLLNLIATLNGYRSVLFLDGAGAALAVISVMTILILLQRSGELHPLLAAGIPMYRVLMPLVFSGACVNSVLMLNREVLVPRVAFLAHELRHKNHPNQSQVESLTDLSTGILIDGAHVNVAKRTIDKPSFLLPPPRIAKELTPLEAEIAYFHPADDKLPSGWFLQNITSQTPEELSDLLTDEGKKIVIVKKSTTVFVKSAITGDQLFQRSSSYTSLSTLELLDRIRCPAFGLVSVRRLVLYLHSRLVQPIMNVIALLIAVPLMVRRESPGLVADSSLCGLILAALFGITQGFQSLGATHLISPELAAWAPVVIGGSISAWLSGVIRT